MTDQHEQNDPGSPPPAGGAPAGDAMGGVAAVAAVLAAGPEDGVADGSGDGPMVSDRDLADEPKSDYGNGRRLVKRYGPELRAVQERQEKLSKGWLAWCRTHWSGERGWIVAQKRAHATAIAIGEEARALAREAPTTPEPGEAGKDFKARQADFAKRVEAHHKWAVASGMAARTAGLLSAAAPYLSVLQGELDADPRLLACANGTLELPRVPAGGDPGDAPQVALRAADKADLITRHAPTAWCAGAECPQFRALIEEILPDADVRGFLQRWLGYCLTGETGEQKAVFLYGQGANGKSTLLNVLRGVLGDYVATLPFAAIGHDQYRSADKATPDLMGLPGARIALASEPEVGAQLSESRIKEQAGGEPINVRALFGDMTTIQPTHKLMVSFNQKPKILGQDAGIWRRIALVPFDVTIPEERRRPTLARDILRDEAAGVFAWLVDGFYLWREQGLEVPEVVKAETAEYRRASDPLAEFFDQCTELLDPRPAPGEVPQFWKTTSAELWNAYQAWAKANAVEPVSQTRFGKIVVEKVGGGRFKAKMNGGRIGYLGIRVVLENVPQDQDYGGRP